jgi:hypothetical protein
MLKVGDATANAIDACVYYLSIASAVEGKRGRNPIPVGHYHSGNETDVDLVTRCALLAECAITRGRVLHAIEVARARARR